MSLTKLKKKDLIILVEEYETRNEELVNDCRELKSQLSASTITDNTRVIYLRNRLRVCYNCEMRKMYKNRLDYLLAY